MSGTGPESVPTFADPRSKRPTKKRALTPTSAQAATLDALFARPDQTIRTSPPPPSHDRRLPAPPDIVTNVQGSSAGAGSGEFHVYKAARRREAERLRRMEEDAREEKEAEAFERERREREDKDEERTRKNREKREKMKARKAKAKKGGKAAGGGGGGKGGNGGENRDGTGAADGTTTRLEPRKDVRIDSAGGKADGPLAPQASSGANADKDQPSGDIEAEGLVIHEDD